MVFGRLACTRYDADSSIGLHGNCLSAVLPAQHWLQDSTPSTPMVWSDGVWTTQAPVAPTAVLMQVPHLASTSAPKTTSSVGCKDDDTCLVNTPGWGSYSCQPRAGRPGVKKYCGDSQYAEDLKCCPVACGTCSVKSAEVPNCTTTCLSRNTPQLNLKEGAPCIFPFSYNYGTHNQCISEGLSIGTWCYIAGTDSENIYHTRPWAYCLEGCPMSASITPVKKGFCNTTEGQDAENNDIKGKGGQGMDTALSP